MEEAKQAVELDLEAVCVSLNGKSILRGIDLQVPAGALVSLLGPSGCGKSTLLKSVAGLLPVESGVIRVDGVPLDGVPPEKRGTVIVFQELRLFPNMTAAGNIAFALRLQGIGRREQEEAVERLLEGVRLEGMGKRRIWQMSGGQQQRVALARAIAARPRVLLLDEPFSSLDEGLRAEMRALVLELHREYGMTTVLVTHDKSEALYMSDLIALMIDGEIVQYGTPEALYSRPAGKPAADYFGGCSYIPGDVREGLYTCPFFSCRADECCAGKYLAMVRPGMLELVPGNEWLVKESRYLGERRSLVLESAGIVLTAETAENYGPGSRVGLRFHLERIQFYQDIEGAP